LLYVEDEPENFAVAELRLGKRFNLLWAKDDEAACALIKAHAGELVAILMDVQLKGSALDGLQLMKLIRGQSLDAPIPSYAYGVSFPEIPIFVVTAFSARYRGDELVAMGASHFVTKPVDFQKLSLALALALATASMRRVMTHRSGGP
jgi:CheY-like chemotaxis protein